MKGFGLLLSVAVSVTASPLERRQLGNLAGLLPLVTPFLPQQKPIKVETLKPTIEGSNVKRVALTYGPYKLRGANSTKREGNVPSLDPQGTGWAYMAQDFPSNITLLAPKMSIVHENGEEISNSNNVYNHHAFFFDVSRGMRSNIQCEGGKSDLAAVNAIMGSAADASSSGMLAFFNRTNGRPTIGNYIAKNSRILLSGDLVNYNKEPRDVYMVADIQYVEGKAVGLWETALHLISVGTCESKDFLGGIFVRPPKDKKQWSLKGNAVVKDDGRILAVRGHMHDGGKNMVLRVNGELVCDSKTEYRAESITGPKSSNSGMEGMISNMVMCLKPVDVKKGDKLSMEAYYDMEKHPSREHPGGGMSEQMALMAIVFGKELK